MTSVLNILLIDAAVDAVDSISLPNEGARGPRGLTTSNWTIFQ